MAEHQRIAAKAPEGAIIALDKFILATRDSGYKGTSSALCELVDNSLQAGANTVAVTIRSDGVEPNQTFTVTVQDDGSGMDPFTLRQALRFGGSSRFNDRQGLGRYGMGLPNASLSQARTVTVFSWQRANDVYQSYLDVDEIAAGALTEVPQPRRTDLPAGVTGTSSGTLVRWSNCDRLDNRRVSTLTRKLAQSLGQTFRHFLWKKLKLTINGETVRPVDPLFLRRERGAPVAEVFGEPLEYEVRASPTDDRVGKVTVTFTLLPVHELAELSNEEKREIGVSKGAGVSIVRGGREVDYGWFFMGGKRRENYDDWFRCQIEFEPVLDEAFGITHTKQQIRPQQYLVELLSPDIEQMAHALNSQIRKAHSTLQVEQRVAESEKVAAKAESLLRPLAVKNTGRTPELAAGLLQRHPSLRQAIEPTKGSAVAYRIVEDERVADFFTHAFVKGQFVLAVNPNHTFFKKVYRPLAESDEPRAKTLRGQLDLLLLSAARAEVALAGKVKPRDLEQFRKEWSDTLATYLTT